MRGFPLRSRIAIKLAMGANNRGRAGNEGGVQLITGPRVFLFTVWNTTVETDLFLACYRLLRLFHAHQRTKRTIAFVVIRERDPRFPLSHI